eukprot:5479357-Pyramimonas_sp.AAC.1
MTEKLEMLRNVSGGLLESGNNGKHWADGMKGDASKFEDVLAHAKSVLFKQRGLAVKLKNLEAEAKA